jgi:hypothetical protein
MAPSVRRGPEAFWTRLQARTGDRARTSISGPALKAARPPQPTLLGNDRSADRGLELELYLYSFVGAR